MKIKAMTSFPFVKLGLRLGVCALVCALAACGDSPAPGKGRHAKGDHLDSWMNHSAGSGQANDDPPILRVLAVSPVLPPEAKTAAAQQIEAEADWIATRAPEGSEVDIVNALDCQPVASLKAARGVARIRKKGLLKPLAAVRTFLRLPHPRAAEDGRIHLPHLTQTMAQLRLPAGTHVTVFGSPLFRNEGADKFFDMSGGRTPSDGMLSEDPKLSLFSVLGREHALSGQYWHLGFPSTSVFADDTHQQSVLRFLGLYLRGQGATLVTCQPSLEAAALAARDQRTEALSNEQPDPATPAEMVTITKEINETNRPVRPPPSGQHAEVPKDGGAVKGDLKDRQEKHAVDANTSAAPASKLDAYQNPVGEENDLVGDGEMQGTILLICFNNDPDVESSPLAGALATKGWKVERIHYPLPGPAEWDRLLARCQQVWLFSSAEKNRLPGKYASRLVDRWRQGKLSVCLLADNDPFTVEAQQVLDLAAAGTRVEGNYPGEQILHARDGSAGGGFLANHAIFHNLTSLYEGNTISHLEGNNLSPVCWASDGKPLICTFEQGGSGRMLCFGGYTAFYKVYWNKAGNSRLGTNLAGWLAGLDRPRKSPNGQAHPTRS